MARRVLKDRVGLSLTSVVRNRRKLASRSWRRYGSHGNDQQEQPDRVTSVIACWMLCCVVDCRTTLLGSLKPLSHRDTREMMVEHEGQWFATSLLQHEHAEHFANPPECGRNAPRDHQGISLRSHRTFSGVYVTHSLSDRDSINL